MLPRLFFLRSLGCCGCFSTLITLLIAAVLLLVFLELVMPGVTQSLCTSLVTSEGICPTPVP